MDNHLIENKNLPFVLAVFAISFFYETFATIIM